MVQFAADRAGDVQEERIFGGGLVDQLRDCLNYLENLSAFHLQKQPDRSQVRGWVSYPMQALRETLVNAVYIIAATTSISRNLPRSFCFPTASR